MAIRRKRAPEEYRRTKIQDPAALAEKTWGGSWELLPGSHQWDPWACHFTTRDFSQVAGIAYHNNCGPTAVTNLVCMARRRLLGAEVPASEAARQLYHQTARYGVRHLFFINSENRFLHGSSDLRAGSWVRRMARRQLDLRPKLRLRRISDRALRQSLDRGALAYQIGRAHV